MNIRRDPSTFAARMDRDAFLVWADGRAGRFELVDGTIVDMTGASRNHVRLSARFIAMIAGHLDPSVWDVLGSDFAVEAAGNVRYPDILVEPAGGSATARATTTPTLVVEVLSPSTETVDLVEKRRDYCSLESLAAYVVARQDAPELLVWERGVDGRFPDLLASLTVGDTFRLNVPPLSLAVSDIYAGITPIA